MFEPESAAARPALSGGLCSHPGSQRASGAHWLRAAAQIRRVWVSAARNSLVPGLIGQKEFGTVGVRATISNKMAHHGQASRIRELASAHVRVDDIAAELRVRRLLGRSDERAAPRKRVSSSKLSFITTPDIAEAIRREASVRGLPVSDVVEELVRSGLSARSRSSSRRARHVAAGLPR